MWNKFKLRIDYIKRLIGTAIGFSLFGLGGLLLCLTLFQMIRVLSRGSTQRRARVRSLICYIFRGYLKTLEILGVIKVEARSLEELRGLKGTLVICNHPSLLDVVILMSKLKNVQCVVKNELWRNPLIGGVVRSAGYIRNDIDPERFLKDCKEQLDQGENIIIFPEGTRSIPGHPIHMRRGLGNLALAADVNIQTILLGCEPVSLTKSEKWYHIPPRRINFKAHIGKLFLISDYQGDAPRSLRVRALMRDIQHYYNRYLGYE
ncbi:lysophospholipid acyltransferase family protein [Candidatus Odyssella thessalonicensis]|uniref:lysophospholipid acyltransferase family protein n=1 Tax=Candidatus Odyssella thessalonicensis TaxID=84647 RepID=UPI000225BF9B|nr:lysophospholipid acyltransferase family protein [Candidatus Odyssella thessalonicensis]